jgi:hypothetical protein
MMAVNTIGDARSDTRLTLDYLSTDSGVNVESINVVLRGNGEEALGPYHNQAPRTWFPKRKECCFGI